LHIFPSQICRLWLQSIHLKNLIFTVHDHLGFKAFLKYHNNSYNILLWNKISLFPFGENPSTSFFHTVYKNCPWKCFYPMSDSLSVIHFCEVCRYSGYREYTSVVHPTSIRLNYCHIFFIDYGMKGLILMCKMFIIIENVYYLKNHKFDLIWRSFFNISRAPSKAVLRNPKCCMVQQNIFYLIQN